MARDDSSERLDCDSGEELYLQLDIGLLPVEMRTAFLNSR